MPPHIIFALLSPWQKRDALARLALSLLLSLCLAFGAVNGVAAQPKLPQSEIGGKAHILVEANSGVVLTQYRATERLAPASITKLMTAYVVYQSLEAGLLSLDDMTVISARARSMTEGSRMFLERGSHVSIDDLLSGLVIQSGNDAAVALAEAVAGDEARFIEMMNKQAKALGMNDSQFKNVTGLTETGHYMSAKDIATLAAAIIQHFPKHYRRYRKKSFTWNGIKQGNRNALLYSDPNVDGLKTGYTAAAGYCLTASAKRGKMRLISVVLGTSSIGARARASKKLLAFGFDNFMMKTLYSVKQQLAIANVENGAKDTVGVVSANTINLPLPKTGNSNLKAKLVLDDHLQAPLAAGQSVGQLLISQGDNVLSQTPAVTQTAVEEIGFFKRLWRNITDTVSGWFS